MDYQVFAKTQQKSYAKTIEITIESSIKSNQWLRAATIRAQIEATRAGN